MPGQKENPFFSVPQPSAAAVPHLITALDPEFLQALVQTNGAKLGLWNVPAPYDAENRYEPYRENARYADWALAYNQNQLLNNEVLESNTMITDCSVDEAALEPLSEMISFDEEPDSHSGYQNLADFPGLLKKITWALVPMGKQLDYVLFVAAPVKQDYVKILQQWCHTHGRIYYTIVDGGLKGWVAPEISRAQAVQFHGQHFLQKMSHFGISAQDVQQHFDELLNAWVRESRKADGPRSQS